MPIQTPPRQVRPDSEELLRSLVMSLTDLVISIDFDDRILFYHQGQGQLYDTPVDITRFAGKRYQDVLPTAFSTKLASCIPEVTSTLSTQHIEFTEMIDAVPQHFSARITPMISPTLNLIGCTIVARNISEQVNARARQQHLYELENFMHASTAAFLTQDDPALALRETLALLGTVLEVDNLTVYHLRESAPMLDRVETWQPANQLQAKPQPNNNDEPLLDELRPQLLRETVIHLYDQPTTEALRRRLWGEQGRSGLLMPFMVDQRLSGFFAVGSSTPRAWLPEEIAALSATAQGYARACEKQNARIDLIHARDAALQSDKLKSEFMANMSHEIRTPMTGVMGMLDLLGETQLTSTQADFVDVARESANKLLNIVNDVLNFSKLDAGRLTLETIPFDLRGTLHEVVELFTPQTDRKGLALDIQIADDLPAQLLGDPTRLHQVLLNLLNNALKFTTQGSISIRADALNADGTCTVKISVSDTGIGIPDEKQAAIFDSFVQADNSTTRRYGGAGLGLTICKQLLALMQGSISVSSVVGRGSTFTIELPLPIIALTNPTDLDEALRRLHVMILDPNDDARRMLADQLRDWGTHVIEMADASEAFALMARAAHVEEDVEVLLLRASDDTDADNDFINSLEEKLDLDMPRIILLTSGDQHPNNTVAEFALPLSALDALHERLVQIAHFEPFIDLGEPPIPTVPSPSSSTRRILLADDNPVNCQIVLDALLNFNYKIDIARNGEDALVLVATHQYDLLLMDVQMPVIDGIEATRQIRARADDNASAPIIAMTASVHDDEQERYFAAGMNAVLGKPFTISQLRHIVQKWMPERDD